MVIERFRNDNAKLIGERFQLRGRMLPEGVTYHASWVDAAGTRCFQVMEAQDSDILTVWVRSWEDLIEFEIVPVLASADFWANIGT